MIKIKIAEEYQKLLLRNNIKKINSEDIWAYPAYPYLISKNYGWKIHLSAVLTNAIDIAKIFFEINKQYKFDFKIISSVSNFEKINMGYYGNSQVGKFITIYPPQDKVLQTLELLYYTYHNFVGLSVGSDFSYKLSSNVYYRFGTLLEDVDNIDKRDKKLKPFKDSQNIPDYYLKHFHQIPNNYLILKVLKQIGPSGVFLGLDTNTRKKVVIRYASKFYNLESSNIDENDRLLSTSSILNIPLIKKDQNYENIIDTFYVDNSVFIVTEYISGNTLEDMALSGKLNALSLTVKLNIFKQMAKSINKLNKLGITFRDISFNNVIITKNLQLKIIDFNYAISKKGLSNFAGRELTPSGTYGFYDPEVQLNSPDSDKYGLAQFLYFIIFPEAYISFISQINTDTTYSEIVTILNSVKDKPLPKNINELYLSLLRDNEAEI